MKRADTLEARFAISVTAHVELDATRLQKEATRQVEAKTMLSQVARGLGFIPFELNQQYHSEHEKAEAIL